MSKYLDRAKEIRAMTAPVYNCGQTVVLSFAEEAGISEETAAAICANFGGGLRRGAACGAITGGLIVLGLFGIDSPAAVGAYYRALRDSHDGKLDCADLLRRSKELGVDKTSHCNALIFECVTLVEQVLREQGKIR